jgi:hypothetical protein
MKNRDNFVKKLKYFNENYFLITENKGSSDNFESRLSKEEIEYFSPLYHKLNISKILQITLEDNNCFKDFYELDDEMLFYFFEVLTKIDKALMIFYQQVYSVKNMQETKNRNDALIAKVDDVLKYADETNSRFSQATLDDLEGLKQSLKNSHFTKRQLFESLLFHITIFLNKDKNTKRTSDIANSIIEKYFDVDDISFSKDTNIQLFKGRTYNYGYLKNLTLHHR